MKQLSILTFLVILLFWVSNSNALKRQFTSVNAVVCAPGTYSASNSASCTDCPVGTYSSTSAATACTSCAVGTYAGSTGASGCTNCPAGILFTLLIIIII